MIPAQSGACMERLPERTPGRRAPRSVAGSCLLALCLLLFAPVPLRADETPLDGTAWKKEVPGILARPARIRRLIVDSLRRELKNPFMLQVEFSSETKDADLMRGRLPAMEIHALGARVDRLRVREIHLLCMGVRFSLPLLLSRGRFMPRSMDSLEVEAEITEDAFNDLFREQQKNLRVGNPHIRMMDGCVCFSGTVSTFLLNSRVRVAGRLELGGESTIDFRIASLKVGGIPVPSFVTRRIVRRMNPIADFRRFSLWKDFNVRLRLLRVMKGRIVFSSYPDMRYVDGMYRGNQAWRVAMRLLEMRSTHLDGDGKA